MLEMMVIEEKHFVPLDQIRYIYKLGNDRIRIHFKSNIFGGAESLDVYTKNISYTIFPAPSGSGTGLIVPKSAVV